MMVIASVMLTLSALSLLGVAAYSLVLGARMRKVRLETPSGVQDEVQGDKDGQGMVGAALAAAGIKATPSQWVGATLATGAAAGCCVFLATKSWVVLPLGVACAAFVSLAAVVILKGARERKLEPQLARALPQMASAMRGGASPTRAIAQVAATSPDPLSRELARVASEADWSGDLGAAMERFATRTRGRDVALLAAATTACQERGGSLSKVFEDTGAVMQKRQELRRFAKSQTASARLEGWMLAAMVVVIFAVLSLMQEGFLDFYLTDAGLVVLLIVALAAILGLVAILAIARVDVG